MGMVPMPRNYVNAFHHGAHEGHGENLLKTSPARTLGQCVDSVISVMNFLSRNTSFLKEFEND